MKINLKSKNLELTNAISEYVLKKVTNLGKILTKIVDRGGDVFIDFEVSKTTNHHRSGEFFQATTHVNIDGKQYNATSNKENLYQAIDEVKQLIFHEINQNKNKKQTLFNRGARKIKNMLKGFKS